MTKRINRRNFLKWSALTTAGATLAACQPSPTEAPPPAATPEPIVMEVTRVVEGETVVERVVVTATSAPVEKLEAEAVLGVLPRSETLIADILTGRVGSPSNFNFWVGWKWQDRGMQQLANEPLWSIDFATGEIIQGASNDDPKYNEDFTECTISLRPGQLWSDGEPFTSEDIVFTVDTLKAYEGFNKNSFFNENVETVTAPDENTVVFKLKHPNSRFHTDFLDRWGCTWFMPKHIFENVEDPVTFEFNPFVGTGPYKLHSFDPNGFWTIWEKRADWDKTVTGMLYGEPQPKYIVFQNFANEGAKILAQLTHQCDAANLSSDGLKAILAQSKSSRAYQPSFPWVVNNDPCITGITYNTFRKPYDLKDVRWALTLAIDYVEYLGIAVDYTGTMSPLLVPHLGSYPKDFIVPMQDFLKEFTIDVDGEPFTVYDPETPQRVVEAAKARGYTFPEDQESIDKAFGLGWFKYAPDVADKLLIKHGFSRDADGKWLLPDGKPWKLAFLCGSDMTHPGTLNANAAVAAWKKFGIDAEVYFSEASANLNSVGDFDVSSNWPATEAWGAGPDLYRFLNAYNSEYVKPLEDTTNGHASRWSSPNMDAILKELRETDPADYEATVAVSIKGLKEGLAEMPGTPTFGYIGFIAWDQTYWENWPGSENPYSQPYTHWGPFKYMTPFLKPTGA